MLTIEYTQLGTAYSDFGVEACAKEIIEWHLENLDQDMTYRVSTENLIDTIRLYIVENRINPEGWLQFKYSEEIIKIDRLGCMDHWVKGFNDKSHNWFKRIFKAQIEIRTEEREKNEKPIITKEENQ